MRIMTRSERMNFLAEKLEQGLRHPETSEATKAEAARLLPICRHMARRWSH